MTSQNLLQNLRAAFGSYKQGKHAQMTNLVTKLFGPPKEISDPAHCLGHLHRWTIFKSKSYQLCLDHALGGGLSRDSHEYSGRFVSIGFAESQDASSLQSFPDGSAWMLLIGKS